MRKRLVIAAISLVLLPVLGALVYRILQPSPGTVAWHKQEYQRALKKLTADSRVLGRTYSKITGRESPWAGGWDDIAQLSSNHTALLRLGYLKQRQFAVTNRSGYDVRDALALVLGGELEAIKAFLECSPATNHIVVIAPPAMMPLVEEIVRKADVP